MTFKCTNDAGLFINNSVSVNIYNIKFVNCGMSTISVMNITSALSLFNVQSIVLSNITFENSLGHGIVGINVLGSSLLSNIVIYNKQNNMGYSSYERSFHNFMGGIILVYVDGAINHKTTNLNNVVLLKHSTICCMSDYLGSVKSNSSLHSIFGLLFYQQKYSVDVEVVSTVITRIVFQNSPLVVITHNSSMPNSVSISNSNFTNINSEKMLIMFITITSQYNFQLSISNCNFVYNAARLIQIITIVENTKLIFKMTSTTTAYNKAPENIMDLSLFDVTGLLTFERCTFKLNVDFKLQIKSARELVLIDNLFYNNSNSLHSSQQGLLWCGNSVPVFKGYNELSFNKADVIIRLETYVYIKENATLNISNNIPSIVVMNEPKSLVVLIAKLTTHPCLFQFLSLKKNLDRNLLSNNTINFRVVFSNNQNYTSVLYGTLLNSCYWKQNSAFNDASPGDVYRRVIHYDTTKNIISKQDPTFCYCERTTGTVDCFKDNFISTPIYPGQAIPISLVQVPTQQSAAIYQRKDVWSSMFLYHFKPCHLTSDQPSNYWLQLIYNECVPLFFKVFTISYEPCSAFFNVIGFSGTTYHFKIGFKNCPLGFGNYNGSCQCNKYLRAAFPTLTCDIDTQTFFRPSNLWIGLSQDKKSILYVTFSFTVFCTNQPARVQLDKPNTQCVGNRVGVKCGQCPPGLSAVFGSFKCKKCSNDMLWLLPIFFIAGILLVFCLFTLDMTVVNGKVNGFILYANITAVNGYYAFPSHKILFVLISLCNLDLGIETCFYHGMTEYDKTWLQFVFPLYLLCIVGVLAITSRYSSCVERLTRKRVIPVIATIFLLSYSKILLVTTKVLFSFTTVHEVDGNNTKTGLFWSWDSSIQLFGKQFIPLFVLSMLVLVGVLLPLNFCLVFTKTSYRIQCVCNYLKPYLDAFQAPFKATHYYYFGIELLIRPILFAIGNGVLDSHKTMTIYNSICVAFLVYLCVFKPFKSSATAVLYISYIINSGFQNMLFLYYNSTSTSKSYIILFQMLIVIALLEFGSTIIYYIYAGHLYRIKRFSALLAKFTELVNSLQSRIMSRPKENVAITMQATILYQLREELLTADPD